MSVTGPQGPNTPDFQAQAPQFSGDPIKDFNKFLADLNALWGDLLKIQDAYREPPEVIKILDQKYLGEMKNLKKEMDALQSELENSTNPEAKKALSRLNDAAVQFNQAFADVKSEEQGNPLQAYSDMKEYIGRACDALGYPM